MRAAHRPYSENKHHAYMRRIPPTQSPAAVLISKAEVPNPELPAGNALLRRDARRIVFVPCGVKTDMASIPRTRQVDGK